MTVTKSQLTIISPSQINKRLEQSEATDTFEKIDADSGDDTGEKDEDAGNYALKPDES